MLKLLRDVYTLCTTPVRDVRRFLYSFINSSSSFVRPPTVKEKIAFLFSTRDDLLRSTPIHELGPSSQYVPFLERSDPRRLFDSTRVVVKRKGRRYLSFVEAMSLKSLENIRKVLGLKQPLVYLDHPTDRDWETKRRRGSDRSRKGTY